jgi:hypothetical protein
MIDIESMVKKYTVDIITKSLEHLKENIEELANGDSIKVSTVTKIIDMYIEEYNKGDNDK